MFDVFFINMNRMFSVGQKILFRRSSGKWENGIITFIKGDFVTVSWPSQDGLTGTKKVHILSVKTSSRKKKCFWIIFFMIALLLLDSYIYLKKVSN